MSQTQKNASRASDFPIRIYGDMSPVTKNLEYALSQFGAENTSVSNISETPEPHDEYRQYIVVSPSAEQLMAMVATLDGTACDIVVIVSDDNYGALEEKPVHFLWMPFRMGELFDTLQLLHRRYLAKSKNLTYQIGPYSFSPQTSSLNQDGAAPVRLTEKEKDILLCLIEEDQGTVSREELLARVWGYQADLETHTAETHIYRLRKKIDVHSDKTLIETSEEGYRLSVAVIVNDG